MYKILIIIILLFISSVLFGSTDFQNLYFIPELSVFNSSALADGPSSLFINPALLHSIDRPAFTISTPDFQTIGYIGGAGIIPLVGGVIGGGLYSASPFTNDIKHGAIIGYGREIFGSLSAGINLKTSAAALNNKFIDGSLL